MREEALELCRSEVGHVADAIEVIALRYGTKRKAAEETGVSIHLMGRMTKRSASERATRAILFPLAQAHGVTVDGLLAGKGPRLEWLDRLPTAEEVETHANAHPVTAKQGDHVRTWATWLCVWTDKKGVCWRSLEALRVTEMGHVVDDDGKPIATWGGRWLRLTAEGVPAR